jgi:hypothetical protein
MKLKRTVKPTVSLSAASLFGLGAMLSQGTTIFSTDFSSIPSNLDITAGDVAYTQRGVDFAGTGSTVEGAQDIDVTALGLTGQWLFTPSEGRYVATLNLDGLTPGGTLDIGFFLNAGGGLDGAFGGQNDSVEVAKDGVTLFNAVFGGRSPDRPGYGDTPEGQAAAMIRKAGESGAPSSNLNEFRTGAWGHDALYDMSLEPSLQGVPITASTATLEFIVNRSEAPTDEYFGLANLTIDANPIPEPGSLTLSGLAGLVVLGLRRRRRVS